MSTPVVLITGALTGIGRAAALAFAKKGAKIVVAGRRDEAGKALVKELCSFGSPSRCRGEQCWHRRPSWPDHGPDRGKLCRDVRHQCSRRDPEHETRSARHARTE